MSNLMKYEPSRRFFVPGIPTLSQLQRSGNRPYHAPVPAIPGTTGTKNMAATIVHSCVCNSGRMKQSDDEPSDILEILRVKG